MTQLTKHEFNQLDYNERLDTLYDAVFGKNVQVKPVKLAKLTKGKKNAK